MRYIIASTSLNIGGKLRKPGEFVDAEMVDAINPLNKAELIKQGVLVPEGTEAPAIEEKPPVPIGDGRRTRDPEGSAVSLTGPQSTANLGDLEAIKDARGGDVEAPEQPELPNLDAIEEVEDEDEDEDEGDDLLDDETDGK